MEREHLYEDIERATFTNYVFIDKSCMMKQAFSLLNLNLYLSLDEER